VAAVICYELLGTLISMVGMTAHRER